MSFIFGLVYLVLYLFLVSLVLRLTIDWVRALAPRWRPHGTALLVASLSTLVTEPVLNPIRRVVPPIRIGGAAVDVSLLVAFIVLTFAMGLFGMEV